MELNAVSILMPIYRPVRPHLEQAIESVLSQTHRHWTLHISEDPSDIDAQTLVEKYLSDSRITFQKNPERLGIGGNWNACFAHAEHPFVQYLFQDDAWHPNYLEQALGILQKHPTVGFVSVDHSYVYESEIPTRNAYEELLAFKHKHVHPGFYKGRVFLRWWIEQGLHPNVIGEPCFVMMRKAALEKAGPFCEDMPQFLDVEMWIRLLLANDWYNLPENLGSFRVHPAAASARNEASGAGMYDRLRCFEQLIASLEGEDRKAAIRARNAAVYQMAEKFLARIVNGKTVTNNAGGNGMMRSFALRHPLLMIASLVRALWKRALSSRLKV